MPPAPTTLPPELGDAFSCARAIAMGVTPRRLRATDLLAPHRGARLRREPPPGALAEDADPFAVDRAAREEVLRRARTYREVMPTGAFLAGRTAGVAYGWPIDNEGELEIAVLAPGRAPRCRGIRGIQVSPQLVTLRQHAGFRLTSPASTWAMLGAELTVRDLVVVGDAIVRVPRDPYGTPLPHQQQATIAELRRATEAGKRRGAPKLRAALELIRVGSASPLETDYRLDAAEGGLPEPMLDVEIRNTQGRLLGVSDAVYPGQHLVVEVEGDHHRTTRAQWNRDIEKYAAYAAEGWEVVRLTSQHIRGRERRATAIVWAALVRRGWQPPAA